MTAASLIIGEALGGVTVHPAGQSVAEGKLELINDMAILRSRGLRCPTILTKDFAVHSKNVVKFTWTHPSNKGSRASALLRLARFQMRGRFLRRPTIARLGKESQVWANLHRYAALKVVCANPPDHPEMIVWRNSLRSGDLFVDVGANIGSYAIWAADLGAEVIALEPAEDTFALLQRNVDLNGYSIHTIQAAAGAQRGIVRFSVGRDDWNRFDPAGGAKTAVVTLDSVIGTRAVAGMKVDVEGFEIDVLRGCAQALSERRIGLIQLEWNSTSQGGPGADRKPVADLLDQHGYRLFRPDRLGVLNPLTDLGFGPDVFARPG